MGTIEDEILDIKHQLRGWKRATASDLQQGFLEGAGSAMCNLLRCKIELANKELELFFERDIKVMESK